MKAFLAVALSLSAFALAGAQRSVAEPRLAITGDVSHRHAYTNSDLAQTFRSSIEDVSFTLKGEMGHAHAFPLRLLIEMAQPKSDPKRKHAPLAFAIVASAADGYAVTFSMAELARNSPNGRSGWRWTGMASR